MTPQPHSTRSVGVSTDLGRVSVVGRFVVRGRDCLGAVGAGTASLLLGLGGSQRRPLHVRLTACPPGIEAGRDWDGDGGGGRSLATSSLSRRLNN